MFLLLGFSKAFHRKRFRVAVSKSFCFFSMGFEGVLVGCFEVFQDIPKAPLPSLGSFFCLMASLGGLFSCAVF